MNTIKKNCHDSKFIDELPPVFAPSIIISHGWGDYVFDSRGKKYIDFTGGIAVNAFGHRHDIIGPAVRKQLDTLIHCSNYFTTRPHIQLCRELVSFANKALKKTQCFKSAYISNSGTEAVEAALKFARITASRIYPSAGKNEVIYCANAFHGRTMGALSVTAREQYKKHCYPLIPNCTMIQYNDSTALEHAVSVRTAAVIVEPLQGEGGLSELTPEFAETIMGLKRKNAFVIIADEVQTGLYRTGAPLACIHYGLEPDIITLAKALGGGLPIGATILNDHISNAISVGDHGSTMGGNPVVCQAARAILKKMRNKLTMLEVHASADALDTHLEKITQKLGKRFSVECTPLGRGHLRGIMLPSDCKVPEIIDDTRAKGLLILASGNSCIRIAPSLVCAHHTIKRGMDILYSVIANHLRIINRAQNTV